MSKVLITTSFFYILFIQDKHVYYKPVYHRYSKGLWFNIEEGGTPKLHEELSKNMQYSDVS